MSGQNDRVSELLWLIDQKASIILLGPGAPMWPICVSIAGNRAVVADGFAALSFDPDDVVRERTTTLS